MKQMTEKIYKKLYQDVRDFRVAFGLPVECNVSYQEAKLHNALVSEELVELASAVSATDKVDALVDLAYVTMGRHVNSGDKLVLNADPILNAIVTYFKVKHIDFIKCWDEVHRSNMSKACINIEEAELTVAKYRALGVSAGYSRVNGMYAVYCAEDCILKGVPIKRGKILKSISYKPADFSKFVLSE